MCNWTLIIRLPTNLPNAFLLALDLFWSQLHRAITPCFSRCWVLTHIEIRWRSELEINSGKNSPSHSAHQSLLPSHLLLLSPTSQWKRKPQRLKPCEAGVLQRSTKAGLHIICSESSRAHVHQKGKRMMEISDLEISEPILVNKVWFNYQHVHFFLLSSTEGVHSHGDGSMPLTCKATTHL